MRIGGFSQHIAFGATLAPTPTSPTCKVSSILHHVIESFVSEIRFNLNPRACLKILLNPFMALVLFVAGHMACYKGVFCDANTATPSGGFAWRSVEVSQGEMELSGCPEGL